MFSRPCDHHLVHRSHRNRCHQSVKHSLGFGERRAGSGAVEQCQRPDFGIGLLLELKVEEANPGWDVAVIEEKSAAAVGVNVIEAAS